MEPLISHSDFSVVVHKNKGHVYDDTAGTSFQLDRIYHKSNITYYIDNGHVYANNLLKSIYQLFAVLAY